MTIVAVELSDFFSLSRSDSFCHTEKVSGTAVSNVFVVLYFVNCARISSLLGGERGKDAVVCIIWGSQLVRVNLCCLPRVTA